MPVKRRRGKLRMNPHAEAEVWSMVFASSHDFLGDVADLTGLTEPAHVRPPDARAEAEKAWIAAAHEAWGRVGRLYLDTLHDPATGAAWASEQFGEPEQCR